MRSDTAIWVSAGATTLAALVALFGPALRSWWTRPRIALHRPVDILRSSGDLIYTPDDEEDPASKRRYVLLDVTNHGRTQLDNVEAVLTAYDQFGPIPPDPDDPEAEEIPGFDLEGVSRGLLQFELADAENPRITIPPRSTRTLRLAFLATDAGARAELTERREQLPNDLVDVVGGWTLWPLEGTERMPWLIDSRSTRFDVAISARNARSRTWRATVRAWHWSGMEDEPADVAGVTIEWEKGLQRVRGTLPPPAGRAWMSRHTPWAWWHKRRFMREMEAARSVASSRDAD